MSELNIFNYKDTEVRTATLEGEPAIVLSDIAKVLGYRDANTAGRILRDHHKGYAEVRTPGGSQRMIVVTEQGFNRLVIRSNAKNAEEVQDWVTDEVMPSIRKTGSYGVQQLEGPALMAAALIEANNTLESQRAELEAAKPKVIFADSVAASHTDILIGELAKILRGNGIHVGQNRLFEWMRKKGYLIRRKGTDWNMPTQRAMELGLFRIKETSITHSDGHTSISKTVKVTGKGQQYFINIFLNEDGEAA